jgi:hypothetical protein
LVSFNLWGDLPEMIMGSFVNWTHHFFWEEEEEEEEDGALSMIAFLVVGIRVPMWDGSIGLKRKTNGGKRSREMNIHSPIGLSVHWGSSTCKPLASE